MALETLKDLQEIGGFEICHTDHQLGSESKKHILIGHSDNEIRFRIQKGPIKEVGVNGCQVDTIIETAMRIIHGLNEKFPCDENESCLASLGTALTYLKVRKMTRENRGVEGTNES